MQSVRKPWWQQAAALVTVSTGGAITGFTFVPGTAATMTSPSSVPVHLLALERAAKPAETSDARLRSAIVNVAGYYLQLAQSRTPAQMEALIWGADSLDGADHGPSCAAFASLTLELAAQAVGEQSWVTGGSTYPWPLHEWVDARVDENSASPGITSIVQDAQAHQRWHPLGDGYQPQPGDWVLFSGHVEVVTSYSNGVLDTIGADSLPNFTVNAHTFPDPLAQAGVEGFVDNGHLAGGAPAAGGEATRPPAPETTRPAAPAAAGTAAADTDAERSTADIPGTVAPASDMPAATTPTTTAHSAAQSPAASAAGTPPQPSRRPAASAAIPGAPGPGRAAAATSPAAPRPSATSTTGAGSPGAATSPAASPPSRRLTAGSASPVAAATASRSPVAVASGTSARPTADQGAAGGQSPGSAATSSVGATALIPGDTAPDAVTQAAGVAPAAEPPARGTGTTAPVAPGPLTAAPDASVPGLPSLPGVSGGSGHSTIPGLTGIAAAQATYRKSATAASAATPGTRVQQAFINEVAPGAMAAQQRFGVPAAVTIAQAIDESGWGTSGLATQDHNLFGIKGTGPAGSVTLPTEEYENGQWVSTDAQFRVYHNVSESISDHAELLATSGYYQRAMADRAMPDAFANDLTGVYATDPDYGANLIALMRLYDLYRFDTPATQSATPAASPAHASPAHASPAPATQAPATEASIPGVVAAVSAVTALAANAATATAPPSHPASPTATGALVPGTALIPGLTATAGSASNTGGAASRPVATAAPAAAARQATPARGAARVPGVVTSAAVEYQEALPRVVATAFFAKAKAPLARAEQLHRDVAGQVGLPWQLLAACDWMQCQADPRYSPVQGERLGTLNADGTAYRTKSAALAQCAGDLIELAFAIYGLDLTKPRRLSVRALADAFAAFRWGGLLKRHQVSAMEFPYAVAGLTVQHLKMHWPAIDDRDAPDRPGARFRMPFGAVPTVLSLHYPATV